MDSIAAVDNSQQNSLWELLFKQQDEKMGMGNTGGGQEGNGIKGLDGQNQCCGMSQDQAQNGITYNNSGIVINININFNFVNSMA